MSSTKLVDREFASLLQDYLKHEVFRPGSVEASVVAAVAAQGLDVLDDRQLKVWNERVLPIVSKPLHEQAAVAAILRNGGYVPRRFEA